MPSIRFISTAGPNEPAHQPVKSITTAGPNEPDPPPEDVRFLESAATLEHALQRKHKLTSRHTTDPAIVIYRNSLVEPQAILVPLVERSDEINTPEPIKSRTVSFDLFSIPRHLLAPDKRTELAIKIEKIVNEFSQEPSATAAGPR